MAALRLALPQVGFVLSTRESAELRDELAPTVVTQMSAGSSTEPGGYASQESTRRELPQFEIADRRTIFDVRQRLRELGLQPD